MLSKLVRSISILAILAMPAAAAVTYTAVTHTVEGGSSDPSSDIKVRAVVDGDKARVEFVESQIPALESGKYLVSSDGGTTVYLVDPRARTYSHWDNQTMLASMADLMRQLRGGMRVRFEDSHVEKLLDEPGEPIAGLATQHYRYRTTYLAKIELAGTDTIFTTMDEDIWTTSAFVDRGLSLWANTAPVSSGDEQLDRLLQAEKNKVQGFPLKRITVLRTKTSEGKSSETSTEMDVLEMKRIPAEAFIFTIPKGFRRARPTE